MATETPLPRLAGLVDEFYAWTRRGELRFQRCTRCGSWQHLPRYLCARCHCDELEWALSAGRGEVYTFTITHRAMHPAFDKVPYATAIVETVEGVHLTARLIDVDLAEVRVGLPVEVALTLVAVDVVLPYFRPRGTSGP